MTNANADTAPAAACRCCPADRGGRRGHQEPFSGLALETDSGTLESLQAFLLGKENAGGTDCNGDGVVDGMDLALLRQQQFDGGEIQDGYAGFIRTDGKLLVDENGKQYLIKGMAIGNNVWSNPTTAPAQDHDAASYQELADMGFDSVRFYLNYAMFESDSKPYTYREEGFRWLDTNIAWAKAAGIRLVLNMHYPQGGYQSQGNGTPSGQNRKIRSGSVPSGRKLPSGMQTSR